MTLASVTADRALSLSAVFRSVQVLTTSGQQLTVDVWRSAKLSTAPSLVKTPSLASSRSDFIGETIASLALDGNAFWKINRPDALADVTDMEVLPPQEVYVGKDYNTGELVYSHKGKLLPPWQIRHLQFLRRPGQIRGLGPIQAAREDLKAAMDVRDYAANWFTDGDVPNGILRTEKPLNAEQAKMWKRSWDRTGEFAPADGVRGRDTRVLGDAVQYDAMMLNPADAQFLESQQFSTTQIIRLFGIPASLGLAAVEGTSTTYSNIEQDSIIFHRYTLAGYLRPIEEAWSSLIGRGQDVRFNYEAFLRADTKTRYEGHVLALAWSDLDEIRAIEKMPPLTPEQRARLEAKPAPAPAPKAEDSNAV